MCWLCSISSWQARIFRLKCVCCLQGMHILHSTSQQAQNGASMVQVDTCLQQLSSICGLQWTQAEQTTSTRRALQQIPTPSFSGDCFRLWAWPLCS